MTSVDLEFDQLNSTVDALRRSISNRLMYGVGKDAVTAQPRDWLHAVDTRGARPARRALDADHAPAV